MAANAFDQRAWLQRIGYQGSLEPSLATLHQPLFAHAHTIAYESRDIMLGRTPRLDVPTLQRKMIAGGRGGYCLEQYMLFREGLRSMGYSVTNLQGRVVRGMAIDAPRPAIHMLLQVDMPNGPYLADVGFGNLAPTSALLLREGGEQDDEAEFKAVLRDDFGLNMVDEEIRTCIDVMERKGEKGVPHPFFA